MTSSSIASTEKDQKAVPALRILKKLMIILSQIKTSPSFFHKIFRKSANPPLQEEDPYGIIALLDNKNFRYSTFIRFYAELRSVFTAVCSCFNNIILFLRRLL